MARYEHLQLVRLPEQLERRKHGGGGGGPAREAGAHSRKIRAELDEAIEQQQRRRQPEFIDPALILRTRMAGPILEEEWERLGMTLLSTDEDRTLVLFSSTGDLQAFRERLEAYARGTPEGQRNPAFASFIGRIEEIGVIEPRDRIGLRLRESGFTSAEDFEPEQQYVVDIEIWDLGRRELRTRKLDQIDGYVNAHGGAVLDRYIGPSITMLRARVPGAMLGTLLAVEEIATIDLPPEPDAETGDALELTLGDIPTVDPVIEGAPVIGIIDSGINAHPLLDDVLVGAIGVPEALGTADDWGHGTRVSGVAVFGDLRGQLVAGTLIRAARVASAKVVNDRGRFDDQRLVPSQMREAVTVLNERYNCRIFVIALADTLSSKGGKNGSWAATLDELARELDVVIIVSAGNRSPRTGSRLEQAVTEYPGYLLEATNRFCEPAGAMNVLAVGALAHGEGLDPELGEDVRVRPITKALEPSPFTRVGPGFGGAVKPEIVDVGGTLVFDPVTNELRSGKNLPSAGVLTLHHRPIDRLFAAASGTSYAAPLVAFKASQVLTRFPGTSANLMRALLVGAARIPNEAQLRLQPLGEKALRAVCGYGRIDAERASYSDDHRVVLYAEDELPLDHFAVYQVPIPEIF